MKVALGMIHYLYEATHNSPTFTMLWSVRYSCQAIALYNQLAPRKQIQSLPKSRITQWLHLLSPAMPPGDHSRCPSKHEWMYEKLCLKWPNPSGSLLIFAREYISHHHEIIKNHQDCSGLQINPKLKVQLIIKNTITPSTDQVGVVLSCIVYNIQFQIKILSETWRKTTVYLPTILPR